MVNARKETIRMSVLPFTSGQFQIFRIKRGKWFQITKKKFRKFRNAYQYAEKKYGDKFEWSIFRVSK